MTVYRSKVDAWLALTLVGAGVVSLLSAAYVLLTGPLAAAWSAVVLIGVGVALPLWLLLDTRYLLDSEHLLVRSGPFRWMIPLAGIRSVTETRNPLSSPALSLDRLRIDYGAGRAVMISPRERGQFMQQLGALRTRP